jgi:hypothetical protein
MYCTRYENALGLHKEMYIPGLIDPKALLPQIRLAMLSSMAESCASSLLPF